jgi:hypothetical protein
MSIAFPNSTANGPALEDVIYRIDLSGATAPEVYIPTTDGGGADTGCQDHKSSRR